MVNTNGGEPQVAVYPVRLWLDWVGEYMTDQGECHGANPERVQDVVTYAQVVYPDGDNTHLTLEGWNDLMFDYRNDMEGADDTVTAGCWGTLDDLDGYVHARYENQLEVDGL